jgi:hypothetical protein
MLLQLIEYAMQICGTSCYSYGRYLCTNISAMNARNTVYDVIIVVNVEMMIQFIQRYIEITKVHPLMSQ